MASPNFYVKHQSASSIPCAVHRPPHQKGRRKSASKYKSVVTASIKTLCNEVRGAEESMQNMPSELTQNGGEIKPKSMRNRARACLRHHLAAKRCQSTPKMRPRCVQEAPQRAQKPTQSGQEATKRGVGGTQTLPKSSLERSPSASIEFSWPFWLQRRAQSA